MSEVAVVDVGTGNLFSVLRGVERAGGRPVLVSDREAIRAARRVLLPGVGSFADAMRRIDGLGFGEVLREVAARGTPMLGICLGMQLLFDEGEEEGATPGLGLIPGRVVKLRGGPGLIVPHVGWQRLQVRQANPLVEADDAPWLYFSHSYVAHTESAFVVASVEHGETVPAIVRRGNVFGLQPHPEKSGRAGEALLARFLELETE